MGFLLPWYIRCELRRSDGLLGFFWGPTFVNIANLPSLHVHLAHKIQRMFKAFAVLVRVHHGC